MTLGELPLGALDDSAGPTCSECGRPLRAARSRSLGIGPKCARRLELELHPIVLELPGVREAELEYAHPRLPLELAPLQ